MPLHNVQPGLGAVSEYQAAGTPAIGVLQAGETVTFTKVTSAITIWGASGVTPRWSYHSAGAGSLLRGLNNGASFRVEIKTTTLSCTAGPMNFVAELTNIDADRLPPYTATDNNALRTIA